MKTRQIDRNKLYRNARLLAAGVEPPIEDAEAAREYLDGVEAAERGERTAQRLEAEQRRDDALATRGRPPGLRAIDVAAIRRKIAASGEGHEASAASAVIGRECERIPDGEYASFRKTVNALVAEVDLDAKLAGLERELRAQVVKEPGPYDAGSPHSWVRDVLLHKGDEAMRSLVTGRGNGDSDTSPAAVAERLRRHGEDVARAIRRRDEYGERVRKMLHEKRRQEDPELHRKGVREELRGFGTGGGATAAATSGASVFVSPAFLLDHIWAEYRSPYRAFADQCNSSIPLPEWGLEVYVPIVTTGSSVTSQTEGGAVSETKPVTSFASGQIVTKAGTITVTQQFLDRAGPGIAGDAVLFEQIRNQLDSQVDVYAIGQALASAQGVTDNEAFTLTKSKGGVGGMLADLKSAKNKMHDTAGTRIRGTHAFAIGDLCDYIASYADESGRPVFSPAFDDNRLPVRSTGDPLAEGFTGYVLVGLALFADDNIPNLGTTTNTQVVVCMPDTILQLEGPPIPYCYPPSVAGSLEAILGLRSYVATIARFKEGVVTVTGSAYKASTFA